MLEKEFLSKVIRENVEQKEAVRARVLNTVKKEDRRVDSLTRKSLVFGTILICLLVLVFKPVVQKNADYPHYDDLDSMILHADTIIEGKIISTKIQYLNVSNSTEEQGEKLLYTIYDVEVVKVLKGELENKEMIQIKQMGGDTEELISTAGEKSNLKKESTYLLFLVTYDDSPASLINPTQGAYLIDGDEYVSHENNKVKINREILKQKDKQFN